MSTSPTRPDKGKRLMRYSGDLELPLPFDRDPAQRPSQDLRTLADSTYEIARSNAGDSSPGTVNEYAHYKNSNGRTYSNRKTKVPTQPSPLRSSFFGGLRNSFLGNKPQQPQNENQDYSMHDGGMEQRPYNSDDPSKQTHLQYDGNDTSNVPPVPPSKIGTSGSYLDYYTGDLASTHIDATSKDPQHPTFTTFETSNNKDPTMQVLETMPGYHPANLEGSNTMYTFNTTHQRDQQMHAHQSPIYTQYRIILHSIAIVASVIAFGIMLGIFENNYQILPKDVFASVQFFIVAAATTWIASILYSIWFFIGDVSLPNHPLPLLATDKPFGASVDILATFIVVIFWLSTTADTTLRTYKQCYSNAVIEVGTPNLCLSAQVADGFGIAAGLVYLVIFGIKIYEFTSNSMWSELMKVVGGISGSSSPTPMVHHTEV
ncbi:hypothetical protein QVD99_003834 [Batrachochytrium dendrobatidis]|nr:hypothetical protein O5D80_004142 [Batrachochytrium dendrobatidis]KAK5669440.1 hypothetical protein QVD99_003834 [Batrachochytrium dendrobatidis]